MKMFKRSQVLSLGVLYIMASWLYRPRKNAAAPKPEAKLQGVQKLHDLQNMVPDTARLFRPVHIHFYIRT